MKRLLRENEELRLWLRQAREEVRRAKDEIGKKFDMKEQIISEKQGAIEGLKNVIVKEREVAINTAKKDKEGDHREIPVLFDDQDKDKRDKSRNIFFYDILKYWKDDDIFRELSKIGKVFSINKHWIRWYKEDSTVIEKERDRWQLTRDLTSEEMEQYKTNEYEFVKKIMNKDFLLAERAVEESIKQRMMEKILKVTELSDISMYQHKKDLDNDNAASLVDKVVIAEEKVVDVIKKHRMGVEEELDEDMVTSKKLQ
ncbi:hypothetical protein GLOIN_2v1881393 [Rhizophagus irregularis DAOM 181602=DAOM 197198]|uniref:Uncharacterized protein n=3 Tax=Rhizophagus irregularis TaxID=588596 RepID=U9TQJ0_RHIID|nr:hypothetical protein GLOIN_2v1881393 [Rhizophagus irregularis DAOM 181602=DAOM 197198]